MRLKALNIVAFILLFFTGISFGMSKKEIKLKNIRCEMLINPHGIDVENPRLSCEIYGPQRNIHQTAFQILVASSKQKLKRGDADIWNSGKVKSTHSINVIYRGKPLK